MKRPNDGCAYETKSIYNYMRIFDCRIYEKIEEIKRVHKGPIQYDCMRSRLHCCIYSLPRRKNGGLFTERTERIALCGTCSGGATGGPGGAGAPLTRRVAHPWPTLFCQDLFQHSVCPNQLNLAVVSSQLVLQLAILWLQFVPRVFLYLCFVVSLLCLPP
jgi:hypothetical protein